MIALSYDAARALDDFAPWKSLAADDFDWPWFDLRITGALLAFHHPSARAFAVASRHPAFGAPEEALERVTADLLAARRAPASEGGVSERPPGDLHSNMTDSEYGAAFERVHMLFQPIVDYSSRTLFGHEALVRAAPGPAAAS